VSSRSSDAPSVGSASTRNVHTTSRTSGVSSRPPRPTTSTGSPRERSASSIAGIWLRTRTSTALVGRFSTGISAAAVSGRPAASRHAVSIESAIHSASSAYVGNSAHVTVRPPTAAATRWAGTSSATRAPAARNGRDSALATSRISGRLRQLRVRLSTQASRPAGAVNSAGNRSSVPADAPRQP
jgi:hypothetical protein